MSKRVFPRPHERPPNLDFTYQTEQKILIARTSGVVSISSWPAIIKQTLDEGHQHSCLRFLIDHRGATFHLKFAELWTLPRNAGAFQHPEGARVAVLFISQAGRSKEFIEAFTHNRGYDLKVFEDEELAISWLLEPKPNLLDFPNQIR